MTCCPWQPFSIWLQLWASSNKPAALRWLEDTSAAFTLTPRYDPKHDCPHPIHWVEFHTSVPQEQVGKKLLPQPQRTHKPKLISQDNICSGIALAHTQGFNFPCWGFIRFAGSHLPSLSRICSLQCWPHHTAQCHHHPCSHCTFCSTSPNTNPWETTCHHNTVPV